MPWTPANKGSLRSHDSAVQSRQKLAKKIRGSPLNQILDPPLYKLLMMDTEPTKLPANLWPASRIWEYSNMPHNNLYLRF